MPFSTQFSRALSAARVRCGPDRRAPRDVPVFRTIAHGRVRALLRLLPFELAPETAQREHHAIDGAVEVLLLVGEGVEDPEAGLVQIEKHQRTPRPDPPDAVGIGRDEHVKGTRCLSGGGQEARQPVSRDELRRGDAIVAVDVIWRPWTRDARFTPAYR